jgi:hypothetical protein
VPLLLLQNTSPSHLTPFWQKKKKKNQCTPYIDLGKSPKECKEESKNPA